MLLPIPLAAENRPRRLPRITVTIIILNVIIFALTSRGDVRAIEAENESLERLAAWELTKAWQDRPDLRDRVEAHPSALAYLAGEPSWAEQVDDERAIALLHGYLADYRELEGQHPFYRWGFVPAVFDPVRLLSHMFLHADLLHLGFNMLFLWVIGSVLENDWGVSYPIFYFGFGIAAALAHAASAPTSVEPMVGASGAVAGLMGAFAILHWRARIHIALVYALSLAPRIRLLDVPAGVLLGLWFLEQLFWSLLTADMNVGVAFWAHLGGFAGGVVTALIMRRYARVP